MAELVSINATGTVVGRPCVVSTIFFTAIGGVGTCEIRDGGAGGTIRGDVRAAQNTTEPIRLKGTQFHVDVHATIANGRVSVEYE